MCESGLRCSANGRDTEPSLGFPYPAICPNYCLPRTLSPSRLQSLEALPVLLHSSASTPRVKFAVLDRSHLGPVTLTIAPVTVAEPSPPPRGVKNTQLTVTELPPSGVTLVRLQLKLGLSVLLFSCAKVPSTTCIV